MKQSNHQGVPIKMILFIQMAIIIYTLSGVAGKLASEYPVLSFPFIAFYGLEVLILGVYALVWQQIIKKVELSMAFANRSLSLLWSMLWSTCIFHETITLQNMLGIVVVIVGVLLVNTNGKEEQK